MSAKEKVLTTLDNLGISYEKYDHPPLPTIEAATDYWKDIDATHCKNLFFRNHKGNRHYLVILEHMQKLDIRDLEQRLKQGKISFASQKRMDRYLGLSGGSVSIFGLINDHDSHVHVFLDETLKRAEKISFHPNDNTATLVISFEDLMKYLDATGNSFEFIQLYD